ncbi:tripartite tricarboxylate transporter TctB family protein [Aureimonas pseudogalii]|uniref:Putative tricarboxylic transport membrane protein n=1 Tax=Aureimonas pseudogalii TaxID=1744844 RepID=A0A7W6MLB1_9HYPH|nr:tripartite tricarboxylate transporter TctB family protein [Aureimonas pseudogalii]MBB3999612.1 putative tricarboxylic transport membrane protein [Aureimonas pseudogalii]
MQGSREAIGPAGMGAGPGPAPKAGDVRSRRDVIAGAIFIAIALAFGLEASTYPLGTALRMGPGFMPLFLAVLLAVFGAIVLGTSLKRHETISPTPIPWKAIGLVCAALAVFGEFGLALGLVPVVVVCTFTVALASAKNSPLAALAIALSLAALCWLIFKVGLNVSLPTFGTLFSS